MSVGVRDSAHCPIVSISDVTSQVSSCFAGIAPPQQHHSIGQKPRPTCNLKPTLTTPSPLVRPSVLDRYWIAGLTQLKSTWSDRFTFGWTVRSLVIIVGLLKIWERKMRDWNTWHQN